MKYSETIKPISYLKAHASEIIKDISENQKTMIITHNGEAKAVVQDIQSYEKMQDSLAMLKLAALSNAELKRGEYQTAKETFNELDKEIEEYKKNAF